MEKKKRRDPIVSALLSLLVTGLGQLYNGQPRKAILFLVIRFAPLFVFLFNGTLYHLYGLVLLIILGVGIYVYSVIDAVVVSILKKNINLSRYHRNYIYVLIIAIALGYSFIVDTNKLIGMKAEISSGPSMAPTLRTDDRFVINTRTKSFKYGDIVVFWPPGGGQQQYVKRIIGVGGDTIELKDGKVVVNGQEITEPNIASPKSMIRWGPSKIPNGQYYVLGDNRDISLDSHIFGPITASSIIGKAEFIYWSRDMSRIGKEL